MLAAISSFLAPWFRSGWISVLAKTPQREVDKRARSARAAAVHSLIGAALEKYDLRVLAAKLYYGGSLGRDDTYHLACGKDLLHKGKPRGVRHSQTRGAGDRNPNFAASDNGCCVAQHIKSFLPHLRHMALVALPNDLAVFQDYYFRGR